MSSFGSNLKIIPRAAWIVSFFCYAALATVIAVAAQHDSHMSQWPLAGRLAFMLSIPLVLLFFIPLYGYIYADAKRRGMRYVMWTLLAIFVPDAIGVILYFILRDALPAECPACHTSVLAKFTFCPKCGASVRPSCSQCGRIIEHGWANCAYCGAKVPAPH